MLDPTHQVSHAVTPLVAKGGAKATQRHAVQQLTRCWSAPRVCIFQGVKSPLLKPSPPSARDNSGGSIGIVVEHYDGHTFPVGAGGILGGHGAHRHRAHIVGVQMKLFH
jgi:hypothetical protein